MALASFSNKNSSTRIAIIRLTNRHRNETLARLNNCLVEDPLGRQKIRLIYLEEGEEFSIIISIFVEINFNLYQDFHRCPIIVSINQLVFPRSHKNE